MTSPPLLEIDDLSVSYASRGGVGAALRNAPRAVAKAVDGVSLTVASGELVALVGESGSGKTTTAQSVVGLIRPAGGTIRLAGEDVTNATRANLRRLRRRVQLIYQDPYESLNPRFRIRDLVAEPLVVQGLRSGRDTRIKRALEDVGLTPPESFLNRRAHELSGGQRQRVAIASALVLEPELLLADEPVSMLDVSVRAGILQILHRLRSRGIGILMITHDLSTAAEFADRIAVMYLGRIVEQGSAADVVARPLHPYTRALLSAVPDPDPRVRTRPHLHASEAPDATKIPAGCRFHPRCPLRHARCADVDPALRRGEGEPDGHAAACVLVRPTRPR